MARLIIPLRQSQTAKSSKEYRYTSHGQSLKGLGRAAYEFAQSPWWLLRGGPKGDFLPGMKRKNSFALTTVTGYTCTRTGVLLRS